MSLLNPFVLVSRKVTNFCSKARLLKVLCCFPLWIKTVRSGMEQLFCERHSSKNDGVVVLHHFSVRVYSGSYSFGEVT